MLAADDDAADDCGIMAAADDEDADEDCGGGRVAALAETWRGMRRALRRAANKEAGGFTPRWTQIRIK